MNQEGEDLAVVAGAVAGFQEEAVEGAVSLIEEMIGFLVEGEAEVIGAMANGEELRIRHRTKRSIALLLH